MVRLLAGRDALAGWEVRPIDGLSHAAVAEELRSSRIFVSLSRREGFGLPAAEAMACGCFVVGYDGFGGREFFDPEYCRPVEVGNPLALAAACAEVVARDRAEPGWLRERGLDAARCVRRRYSMESERDDVVRAYSDYLPTA